MLLLFSMSESAVRSQAKELTGQDLPQMQVNFPRFVWPLLHLIASLRSVTDTLTLTGKFAYANDFKSGWRPWLILPTTGTQAALTLSYKI
jgi:hypothetical protein